MSSTCGIFFEINQLFLQTQKKNGLVSRTKPKDAGKKEVVIRSIQSIISHISFCNHYVLQIRGIQDAIHFSKNDVLNISLNLNIITLNNSPINFS